jgi:hypothetical protein
MTINGGLQHCVGKEVSRFEQGKHDFIENIDDVCIHYDGGRVVANESLVAEINARGLQKTTKETGLDRKTIRAILNGKKVKASTLVGGDRAARRKAPPRVLVRTLPDEPKLTGSPDPRTQIECSPRSPLGTTVPGSEKPRHFRPFRRVSPLVACDPPSSPLASRHTANRRDARSKRRFA